MRVMLLHTGLEADLLRSEAGTLFSTASWSVYPFPRWVALAS